MGSKVVRPTVASVRAEAREGLEELERANVVLAGRMSELEERLAVASATSPPVRDGVLWHHSLGGLHFGSTSGGTVLVWWPGAGEPHYLSNSSWASVVAHASRDGDCVEAHQAALRLHRGGAGVFDVDARSAFARDVEEAPLPGPQPAEHGTAAGVAATALTPYIRPVEQGALRCGFCNETRFVVYEGEALTPEGRSRPVEFVACSGCWAVLSARAAPELPARPMGSQKPWG